MIRAFSILILFLLFHNLNSQELIDGFCKDGQGYFEFTDGEYFGECKNQTTMHGEGKYILYSGRTFSGKWKNGKKNGYGVVFTSAELIKYAGDWVDDQMHGVIREHISDDTYEFFIYKNDKKTDLENLCISGCDYSNSNNWVFVWKDGHRYEGNKKNGKRHGKGTYEWRYLDGSFNRYIGDWVEGERTGKGKYLGTGYIYEGDFIKGVRTGKGKITWDVGSTYEGDWVEGERTGFGVWENTGDFLTDRVKGETYTGMYKNNDRHGIGITSYPDGSKKVELNKDGEAFDGDGFCSHGNCENGRGTYVYINGEYYEGKWKDGKRDGAGTLTNLFSGTSRKSLWGNDTELCDYSMVNIQNNALICDQEILKAEQKRKNEQIRKERIAKEKREEQQRQDSYAKREMAKAKMDIDKISFLGVHWGMSLEEIKDEITKGAKCREIGTRKITAIECYSDSVKKEDEFVWLDLINEYIYISCGVMNACDESLEGLKQLAESGIDSRSTGIKSWESMDKLKLQTKEKTGIYLCAEGKKSGAICVTQEPNIKGKPRIGGIYLLKSFIKETKNDSVITTSERRIVKL